MPGRGLTPALGGAGGAVVVKGGVVGAVGRGVSDRGEGIGELPTVGVFGKFPKVGLVVGDGSSLVGGTDGTASGDRVGEGEGCCGGRLAVCGSSERLSRCTSPAVKPTPTRSTAAIPAQAVEGVVAKRVGLLKLAGTAKTSAAYSSKAFARSNSCVMLKGMNCPVLGVAKAPKNKLWDNPSPG